MNTNSNKLLFMLLLIDKQVNKTWTPDWPDYAQ